MCLSGAFEPNFLGQMLKSSNFAEGWSEVEGEGMTCWSFVALFLKGIFCDAITMIHIAITWSGISCLLFLTVNLQCKSVLGSCSLCGVTAWQYPLIPSTQWFKTSINANLLEQVFNSRKPPQWFNKINAESNIKVMIIKVIITNRRG